MKSKTFYTEAAYLVGIILLAFSVALMKQADFGLSMVVAPAYILHLKISQYFPWYSFGMSEYVLQAVLLILLSFIMGRFKRSYLFSFFTAVFYGFVLDFALIIVALIPASGIVSRLIFFVLGELICALSIAMLFHSYLSPEAYELFVKEIAEKTHQEISKVKTIYDCCSCLIGIAMSFAFFGFGHFEGIQIGTIFCALFNGTLIGMFSRFLDSHFSFSDGLKLRRYFE